MVVNVLHEQKYNYQTDHHDNFIFAHVAILNFLEAIQIDSDYPTTVTFRKDTKTDKFIFQIGDAYLNERMGEPIQVEKSGIDYVNNCNSMEILEPDYNYRHAIMFPKSCWHMVVNQCLRKFIKECYQHHKNLVIRFEPQFMDLFLQEPS